MLYTYHDDYKIYNKLRKFSLQKYDRTMQCIVLLFIYFTRLLLLGLLKT